MTIQLSMVERSRLVRRMQTAKVAVQKKAGEFFQPIWRAEGMTTRLGAKGSDWGSCQAKLNSEPCWTSIRQKPSLRSSLAKSMGQEGGGVTNMNNRTARKTLPKSFTAA